MGGLVYSFKRFFLAKKCLEQTLTALGLAVVWQ